MMAMNTVDESVEVYPVYTLLKKDQIDLDVFSKAYEQGNLVLVLCAAWCGTCKGFMETTQQLAQQFPEAVFVWIDIEDDAAVAGDVDVMNFPSFAVFRQKVAVHYGVSLPHQGVVKRLLAALFAGSIRAADVPEEVLELPENIQNWLSER